MRLFFVFALCGARLFGHCSEGGRFSVIGGTLFKSSQSSLKCVIFSVMIEIYILVQEFPVVGKDLCLGHGANFNLRAGWTLRGYQGGGLTHLRPINTEQT